MKIILHIGSVKTGTSAIQSYLADNERWFTEQGWLIPRALRPDQSFESHIVLPALFCDDRFSSRLGLIARRHAGSTINEFRSRVAKTMKDEVYQARLAGCNYMLISNEHLATRVLDIGNLQLLKEWLEQFGTVDRVVVYLRRQDELVASLYSTKLKSGSTDKFEAGRMNLTRPLLDHKRIIERWSSVFPKDTFCVYPYESSRYQSEDIVDVFLSRLGLPPDRPISKKIKNVSLDPEALAILLKFNKAVNRLVHPFKARRVRGALVRLLECVDSGERIRLSEQEAFYMAEVFATTNAWLAHEFGGAQEFFQWDVKPGTKHQGISNVGAMRTFVRIGKGVISSLRGARNER